MLINSYDGLSEDSIRNMSHENLIYAVLRMFQVREIKCEQYRGAGLLPDELADAFRGRVW
jgi:hypothetical protein